MHHASRPPCGLAPPSISTSRPRKGSGHVPRARTPYLLLRAGSASASLPGRVPLRRPMQRRGPCSMMTYSASRATASSTRPISARWPVATALSAAPSPFRLALVASKRPSGASQMTPGAWPAPAASRVRNTWILAPTQRLLTCDQGQTSPGIVWPSRPLCSRCSTATLRFPLPRGGGAHRMLSQALSPARPLS